ncbi:MAG TPA: DUF2924 domain-containing protein [Rhizomicrobium sp.]|nr:DUF2924 domain-containing protein [Rhizomicrobium sp.]
MTRTSIKRQQSASLAAGAVEIELIKLARLPIKDLRDVWKKRLGSEPPAIRSREVMARLLAWRVQAEDSGGLDLPSERKLREIGDALERTGTYEPKQRRDLSPGVFVTREWKGVVHRVAVTTGGFEYDGRRFKSLSDVARTITGTRWSGPRFFGLEQKTERLTRRVAS